MPTTLSVQIIANAIATNEPELRGDLLDAIQTYMDEAETGRMPWTPNIINRVRRLEAFANALGA